MRAKGIKLYLNPNNADERRILDYLRYSGMSYTKAITRAVLFYLDAADGNGGQDDFLQAVRDTIRESVKGLQIPPAAGDLSTSEDDDEEPVSMLDFLDELEGGVTFEGK